MSYSDKTPIYELESPIPGDTIDADSESRKVSIIENQMYGSARSHSGGHGLIHHGNLAVISPSSGSSYSVLCFENKAEGKFAVRAWINQIYVETEDTLKWEGLSNNTTYFLYIQLVEAGDAQSSRIGKKVVTSFDTSGNVPTDGLLIAVVHVNEPGNSIIVNRPAFQTGYVEVPILGDHMAVNQNPHSPFLYQDDLVVSGLTVLSALKYVNLQTDNFIVSGNSIISGNINVLGNLTVSGSIKIHGNVLFNLLQTQNMEIPGDFTVAELNVTSGMDVYCRSTFRKNIVLTSGVTVDGLDPSEAVPLVTKQNADHLHTHLLGSINPGVKLLSFSPEYCNTIVSGLINSGIFGPVRYDNSNFYQWWAINSGAAILVTRVTMPQDFEGIDRIKVTNGVGALLSGSNIQVTVFDKDFNPAIMASNQLSNATITESSVTVSGGQIVAQQPITIVNRVWTHSGIGAYLGDMQLWYKPVNGSKIIYNWIHSGAGNENHFDGLRVAPCDLRLEKFGISERMALSGATTLGLNVANDGVEPTNVFTSTPKPILNFGDNGSQFLSNTVPVTENNVVRMGQLMSVSIDKIASGSQMLSAELQAYRI